MLKNVRQKYDIRPRIVTNISGDHFQNLTNHNIPLFIFNAIVATSLYHFVNAFLMNAILFNFFDSLVPISLSSFCHMHIISTFNVE
jgi:hypothetical protein